MTHYAPFFPLPIQLDIAHLCYNVDIGRKEKQLLVDVNLKIKSGELCAVMGPSGSGKRYVSVLWRELKVAYTKMYSTLLDMIANRKLIGSWSGDILINKSQRPPWFRLMTACKIFLLLINNWSLPILSFCLRHVPI